MKASELRIGNCVSTLNHGIGEVTAIGGDYILYSRNFNSIDEEYLQPIILTEYWLIKFGFDYIGSADPSIQINSYTRIVVPIKNSDVYAFIEISHYNEYDYGQLCITPTEVNSVHQLQNLYYVLTGEELKIKQ